MQDYCSFENYDNFFRIESSNVSTTVTHYNPSAFFLSSCCKKLNINYSTDAYKFWGQVNIAEISSTSRPQNIFETSEQMYHGFNCLSLYLTGTESNTILIREMINRHIYENFKSLGKVFFIL